MEGAYHRDRSGDLLRTGGLEAEEPAHRDHMDWMRVIGGQHESRYRYSEDVVCNNVLFPDFSEAQEQDRDQLGSAVVAARALYPDESLADL